MGLNNELLTKTLAIIKCEASKPPEISLYDQTAYAYNKYCGSCYCFAGWACVTNGDKIDINNLLAIYEDEEGNEVKLDIHDRAERLLGLSYVQAVDLFSSINTLDEVEELVDIYIREVDET